MSKNDVEREELFSRAVVVCGGLVALGFVIRFVAEHFQVMIGVVIGIAFVVAVFFIVRARLRSARQEREEQARAAARKWEMEQEIQKGMQYSLDLHNGVLGADRVIVDTNIWMTRGYHVNLALLADVLASQGHHLTLIGPEFEEVVRLKDAGRADARAGLALIEKLQAEGLLSLERVPYANVSRANFDLAVQRLVEVEADSGKKVVLITDDRELRIRLRARASSNASLRSPGGSVSVYEGASPELSLHRQDSSSRAFIEGFNSGVASRAKKIVEASPGIEGSGAMRLFDPPPKKCVRRYQFGGASIVHNDGTEMVCLRHGRVFLSRDKTKFKQVEGRKVWRPHLCSCGGLAGRFCSQCGKEQAPEAPPNARK